METSYPANLLLASCRVLKMILNFAISAAYSTGYKEGIGVVHTGVYLRRERNAITHHLKTIN